MNPGAIRRLAPTAAAGLLLACLLPGGTALATGAAHGLRMGVLPIVPLDGGAPAGAGISLRDLLSAEISRQIHASGGDASCRPVLLKAAEDGEVACPVRIPENVALGEGGGLPSTHEPSSIGEACASLSVRLARRGFDGMSDEALRQGVVLSPASRLEWESRSRRFADKAAGFREEILQPRPGSDGSVEVRQGAGPMEVQIDGVPIGPGPVQVSGLAPGSHQVRIHYPGLRTSAVSVAVVSRGGVTVAETAPAGTSALGRLLSALGRAGVVDASLASKVASDESLRLLVGGTLERRGEGLVLAGYLYDASAGSVCALPEASFDGELLGAGLAAAPVAAAALDVAAGRRACLPHAPPPLSGGKVSRVGFPEALRRHLMERTSDGSGANARERGDSPSESRGSEVAPQVPADGGRTPGGRRPIDPRRASGALRDRSSK